MAEVVAALRLAVLNYRIQFQHVNPINTQLRISNLRRPQWDIRQRLTALVGRSIDITSRAKALTGKASEGKRHTVAYKLYAKIFGMCNY